MRPELEKSLQEIDQVMTILRRHLDWDKANARLLELNVLAEDPTLWNDSQGAQKVMRERDQLATAVKRIQDLDAEVEEVKTLLQLGEEAGDDSLLKEGEESLNLLHAKCQRLRLESLLSGEADGNDCFVEIHAGAGGTEAQDWALILQRLYVRWAERRNFKLEWIEENAGDEAGIQSCTFKVMGHQAYGWLKTESGVHRLVRISPFDSNAKRHTSFASIWVYPVIDDNIDIVIEDKDIRIDTYRASGAGGQHVNKTDSAVRITHIPTNIVVQCQNDRSQHRNKAQCMSMLKARLYEREMQLREAQSTAEAAAKSAIGWGNQIRSYVLHPYQMVKDMRTGVEMGNTQAVLDGDIDKFLEASLTQRVGEKA